MPHWTMPSGGGANDFLGESWGVATRAADLGGVLTGAGVGRPGVFISSRRPEVLVVCVCKCKRKTR